MWCWPYATLYISMQVINHTNPDVHKQGRRTLCQTVKSAYEELRLMKLALAGTPMRYHETCIGTGKQHGYQAFATSRAVQGLQSFHNVVQNAETINPTLLRQC